MPIAVSGLTFLAIYLLIFLLASISPYTFSAAYRKRVAEYPKAKRETAKWFALYAWFDWIFGRRRN